MVVDDNRPALRLWQSELRLSMMVEAPTAPVDAPVAVWITVFHDRPRSHFGTGRNQDRVRDSAPLLPASGRDLDKVARAVLDVGTGVWWSDDRRVIELRVTRVFAAQGCERTEVRGEEQG